MIKLKKRKNKPQKRAIPTGNVNARMQKYRAKGNALEIDEYTWSSSHDRVKCEKDLQLFCETYLRQRFPLPSSDDQKEAISKIQHAALTGGQFAQSAPRGDGKTQRAVAGALWSALYGHRRYTVPIGATADKGKTLAKEILQELADNEKLARDWPEVCLPFRLAYAKPNRAHYITVNGLPARLEVSAGKIVFPAVNCCKDRPKTIIGNVIEGGGIMAAMRGMRHTTAGMETIRPDFAILDDVQTRKSAMSVGQTERVMAILRGDIKRLAGPDKELAVVCNCTVVRRGDAADQLLDNKANPQWRGVRKKMVYAWPKREDLWKKYAGIRKGGLLDGDGGKAGNDFYEARRADMDEGAATGWNHRYRKESGEVSAIQCAYNILIDDGEEAFQAECQNEPIEKSYTFRELKPDIVMSQLNHLPAGQVPTLARTVNAFVDPNKGWLAWTVCAWQADLTGAVIGYGTHPNEHRWSEKDPRGESLEHFMARQLLELVPRILKPNEFGRPVDRLLVDIGWGELQEAMLAAIVQLRAQGFHQVIPARGSPSFKFKPDIERYEFAQFQEWPGKGPVMVSNTNWHKMQVHRAFAQAAGTPGSITLYGDSPVAHRDFAMSICAEKLEDYKEGTRDGDAGMFKWVRVPAQRNEMLDCITGCRVAACWWRVTTGQHTEAPAQAAVACKEVQTASASAPAVQPQPVQYDQGWGGGW